MVFSPPFPGDAILSETSLVDGVIGCTGDQSNCSLNLSKIYRTLMELGALSLVNDTPTFDIPTDGKR